MLAWWYAEGNRPAGPVAVDGLAQLFRTGRIGLQTQVWHEGMASWCAIATLPELQGIVVPLVPMPAGMPPPQSTSPVTPPRHESQQISRDPSAPVTTGQDAPPTWILPVAGIVVFLAVAAVSVAVWLHHQSTVTSPGQTTLSIDNGGAWENPFNHRRATIDPQWHVSMEKGVLDFKRDRDSASASLDKPMDLGNQTFEDFVREWKSSNSGEVGTLDGFPVLSYETLSNRGADRLLTHYQMIFVGHQIWSILTFRKQSDTGSEADLERLRADIRHSIQ